MGETSLFDRFGEAVAYLVDDGSIYTWSGVAVAYLDDSGHLYAWSGRHIGWWVDDVLFDIGGQRAGFTLRTCPVVTRVERVKSVKHVRRVRGVRQVARVRPVLSLGYSPTPLVNLLEQRGDS